MRVALLGTGRMGRGMARSMRRAGIDVAVWNRTREKAEPLSDDGVHVVGTVTGAVRDADVVITMLFDADSVLAITDDVLQTLPDHAVWLQSSTVGPEGIARIAAAAPDATLVDAPMLGTVQPAEKGALVPLVSGPSDALEQAEPVLDAIGSKTIVVGETVGPASALKLACNAWVLSITAATAQSIALARALDVDPQLFLQAVEGGAADSPYLQMKGKAILADEFDPAFGLDGGRKDLGLITAAAHGAALNADVLDALLATYGRASEAGHGEKDLAAVVYGFAP